MTLVEAYRMLGIDPATARRETVTRRYRELVKTIHPDVRPPGDHDRATAELQRVNEAYAAVRDSGFPSVTTVRPAPPPPSGPRMPYGRPPFTPTYGAYRGFDAGFADRSAPGGFGAARPSGATTAGAPGSGDLALYRRFARLEGFFARSTLLFVVLLFFTLVRGGLAGQPGFGVVVLAVIAWAASLGGRRQSAQIVRILAGAGGLVPPMRAAFYVQLQQKVTIAVGGWIVAFAILGWALAVSASGTDWSHLLTR